MAKMVRDLGKMNEDEARKPTVSDPKEYALGVVNRVRLNSLADRTLRCLEKEGFGTIELNVSPDNSMVRFRMSRGRHAQYATAAEVHRNLLEVLCRAGFRLRAGDLALAVEGEVCEGTFKPCLPQDPANIDPMGYINAVPPNS